MRKLFLLIPFLAFVCSTVAFGQIQSNKLNLDSLIKDYSSRTIKALNKKDSDFRYAVTNKNIFYSDLDEDGDFDAIVEIFFCEESSCHPTTNWSELVVYLRNENSYAFAASKGFSLFGKINSIKDNKIQIDIYGLDEDDPQCCPLLKSKEVYKLTGSKLQKVKE